MKDPREFTCFDSDPRNSGWGYNCPNPYDDYRDEEEVIPDEPEIKDDEWDTDVD
jgi:hypothetical protein